MQTECSAERSMFGRVEGRSVVAEFDGGALTSDAGGLARRRVRPKRRKLEHAGGRQIRKTAAGATMVAGKRKMDPSPRIAPHKPTARNLSTPQRLAGLDHVANRAVDPPRRRRRQKRGLAGQKSAPGLAQGEP